MVLDPPTVTGDVPREVEPGAAGLRLQAALAAVCSRLRRGILLMDVDRRIFYANDAVQQVLTARDAMFQQDGRLVLRATAPMTRLLAFLDQCRGDHANGLALNLALKLDRSNGHPSYRLLASRLELPQSLVDRPVIAIMVFDPHAARQLPASLLTQMYGLTRAEAEVAAHLFSGLDVVGAARRMGLSAATVRSHLRRIFRKCEVASQAQLLQVLALGPRTA